MEAPVGELVGVPAAAEGFDQLDAGLHLLHPQRNLGLLVAQ